MDVDFANEVTEIKPLKALNFWSIMSNQKHSNYFELTPRSDANEAGGIQALAGQFNERELHILDADFSHGGTWAGVADFVETIYLDLVRSERADLLEKHNYELHMVLARYRDRIPLKHGSLTDMARGVEKTRNFPLDRAYRIVHGLIDLVIAWRTAAERNTGCIVIVENYSQAQHLAKRFFLDLARRASIRGKLSVIVRVEGSSVEFSPQDYQLSANLLTEMLPEAGKSSLPAPFASDAEAEQHLEKLNSFDAIELYSTRLLAHYKSKGDAYRYAQVALAALQLCNHFGYYYEASSFVEAVLPYFHRLTEGSEENAWNYAGNLYHSLVVQGAVKEAREIIEQVAKPVLTRKSLRAKMEYVLGIISLRHQTPPDLSEAEEHLTSAVELIRSAREELDPHEHAFLTVFIENGLAFLRVRQGRRLEAIQLCQNGYELLTRELGADKHKLHRSVLQYNTAQVYTMMGDLEAALRYFGYAIQMDQNYSEYYNEVGNILQRQEQFGRALEFYETAIKLSAPYPEVYFNRAICMARSGEWPSAMESCDYSLELKPNQADAHVLRAEICEELGNFDEALKSYDEAIALGNNLVAARVNKAVLLFNQGQFPPALTEMNRVIEIESSESGHYENRAAIYKEMGEWNLYEKDIKMANLLRQGLETGRSQVAS